MADKQKLLIASHNRHKVKEISAILSDLCIEVLSMDEFPDLEPVIEDLDTIEGNAMKKALETSFATGMITLADDTGLFIDALGGEPGVFAARFAGEGCSYEDNQDKALLLMQGKEDRRAEFRTVMALASPDGILALREGRVKGSITTSKKGDGGFGYDPVFEVDGTNLTYAQMSDAQKNQCSHRALALRNILPLIIELAENKIL